MALEYNKSDLIVPRQIKFIVEDLERQMNVPSGIFETNFARFIEFINSHEEFNEYSNYNTREDLRNTCIEKDAGNEIMNIVNSFYSDNDVSYFIFGHFNLNNIQREYQVLSTKPQGYYKTESVSHF